MVTPEQLLSEDEITLIAACLRAVVAGRSFRIGSFKPCSGWSVPSLPRSGGTGRKSKAIGPLGHKLATLPAPGTPFRAAIPNGETVSAMEELDAGRGRASKAATGEVLGRAVKKRS
jgi:hypothetical protein